jgi:exonuclease III
MKALLPFVILSLCTCPLSAQDAPDVCNDGNCIQIGSFNIELLGKRRKKFKGVTRPRRTAEQLRAISDLVTDTLDLEVVVFQEINTESSRWTKLKNNLEAKGYRFFPGTASARNQFVVLAWDSDELSLVEDSAHEMDVATTFGNYEGARKPVAGRFKAGEFDFWVVGVHLKSRAPVDGSTPAEIRKTQCEDLVAKIDAIVADTGEKDVVIVGDFNQRIGHDSLRPLVDGGFTSQMRFLMDASATGSYIKNSGLHESNDLIDHVMIRFDETQEVVRRSAFVMKLDSEEDARSFIIEKSDHVPVWASFRIDQDLDDNN